MPIKTNQIGYLQSTRKVIRLEAKNGWYADIFFSDIGEFIYCKVEFGESILAVPDTSNLPAEGWEFLGKISEYIKREINQPMKRLFSYDKNKNKYELVENIDYIRESNDFILLDYIPHAHRQNLEKATKQ